MSGAGAESAWSEASVTAAAFALANQAVVSDIEQAACLVVLGGVNWFDIRPMLDPREHAPEVIDMAGLALGYALASAVVIRHPEQQHLVRIARRG